MGMEPEGIKALLKGLGMITGTDNTADVKVREREDKASTSLDFLGENLPGG